MRTRVGFVGAGGIANRHIGNLLGFEDVIVVAIADPQFDRAKAAAGRVGGRSYNGHEAMLEAQGGVCAICKEKPKASRLAVDHIHGTDEVRGLLCNLCNPALGLFKDDPERLEAAIKYLKRGEGLGLGDAYRRGKSAKSYDPK